MKHTLVSLFLKHFEIKVRCFGKEVIERDTVFFSKQSYTAKQGFCTVRNELSQGIRLKF